MKCRKHRCCLFKLSNKFPDGSYHVCYRLVGLTNVVNAKLEHVCKIFQAINIRIIRSLGKVCTSIMRRVITALAVLLKGFRKAFLFQI